MLVDDRVILELKAVEALAPVHSAQLLTYLRLTGRAIGLLINFNVPVVKDGIKRIVNRSRIDVSVAPFLRCDPVPSVISVMSNRSLCYPP